MWNILTNPAKALLGSGGPSPYRKDQLQYMDNSFGKGISAYGDAFSRSNADLGLFRPEYQKGFNDYKGYLSRDPYASGIGAVLRAQYNKGIRDQDLAAQAALGNSQQRAGIGGPMAVAQRAALSIGSAKARAVADNNYLTSRISADQQRRGALFNLLSGENARLGAERDANFRNLTTASSPYISYWEQRAQQDEANRAAGRNAVMGLLGQVGSLATSKLFPSSFDKYLKLLGGGGDSAGRNIITDKPSLDGGPVGGGYDKEAKGPWVPRPVIEDIVAGPRNRPVFATEPTVGAPYLAPWPRYFGTTGNRIAPFDYDAYDATWDYDFNDNWHRADGYQRYLSDILYGRRF